jgi:hypothetical protein
MKQQTTQQEKSLSPKAGALSDTPMHEPSTPYFESRENSQRGASVLSYSPRPNSIAKHNLDKQKPIDNLQKILRFRNLVWFCRLSSRRLFGPPGILSRN